MYSLNQTLDRYIRETEAKILSNLLAERELDAVQQTAVIQVVRKAELNTMI